MTAYWSLIDFLILKVLHIIGPSQPTVIGYTRMFNEHFKYLIKIEGASSTHYFSPSMPSSFLVVNNIQLFYAFSLFF